MASEGLYYSLHIYMFINGNQLHQSTHIYIFFSPSLHEQAALDTFKGAINSSNLFFLLHILEKMLLRQWSFIHIYIHTSFESSLLLPAYKLRIESSSSSALAPHWSFTGVPFSVSFPNLFLLRASRSFVLQKKVGDGIRSCALPKEFHTFFPKTTLSWLVTEVCVTETNLSFCTTCRIRIRDMQMPDTLEHKTVVYFDQQTSAAYPSQDSSVGSIWHSRLLVQLGRGLVAR